jgi:hypothetical protein
MTYSCKVKVIMKMRMMPCLPKSLLEVCHALLVRRTLLIYMEEKQIICLGENSLLEIPKKE